MPSIQLAPMVGYPNPATTNTTEGICTCPTFLSEGYCKHLELLGVYLVKNWSQKVRPSFSQALSGLVKALRLRRVEDAVYWLVYLDTFKDQGSRFRVARRLLIGSSEDGHSITIMEKVSSQLKHNCQESTHLCHLIADAVRICYVPNWWHPETGGRDYIYHGLRGDRGCYQVGEDGKTLGELPKEHLQAKLVQAIDAGDASQALAYSNGLCITSAWGRTTFATWLLQLAEGRKCEPAVRLLNIHLTHKSALSNDANFIMQAIWFMAGGTTPVMNQVHVVKSAVVVELHNKAIDLWKNPQPIPGWCCDGIHCGGTDRRFAGMWQDMHAVCLSYEYYQEMHPDLEWLQEFYVTAGLPLHH